MDSPGHLSDNGSAGGGGEKRSSGTSASGLPLRDLAGVAARIASLKGEAQAWLRDPDYDTLGHRLEDAHAAVKAAAVEARRRVRLNEGRNR